MSIHPTAVVDSGASLGKDVSIGAHAVIEDGVTLGDRTAIGPNAVIFRHTSLGKDCEIHAGAVIGDTPQDLAFKDCESFVSIGDRTVIREGVTVHRGTAPGSTTTIGNDCFLMGFSHFAHNVVVGNGVIVANGTLLGGYVEVGDRAFVSGSCAFHQFTKIGRLAMVALGTSLSKDVPPFCTTESAALNSIAGVNTVGMRRADMDAGARREVDQAFSLLYRSGMNASQAVAAIRDKFTDGPPIEMAAFAEESQRGICTFRRTARRATGA